MKPFKLLPLFILSSVLSLSSCSQNKGNGLYPINKDDVTTDNPFFDDDSNLITSELKIDGIKDEEEWNSEYSSEVLSFCDASSKVNVQFYRGESALYGFYDVLDNNLCVLGNNNGDDVVKSDSVELYLDCLNDGGARPRIDDYQFNLGVHNKTRILVGNGEEWGVSTAMCQYEVKLNGTLNNEKDIDVGYTVEFMIPYKQLSIERNSTIGMALGRVDRFELDVNSEYEWFGISVDGVYAEPQKIDNYFTYVGNTFVGRNTIKDPITLGGTITDEELNPLSGVSVKANEKEVLTDSEGKYLLNDIDPNKSLSFEIKKDGFKTYNYVLPSASMYVSTDDFIQDFKLIKGNGNSELSLDYVFVGETTKTICKDNKTPIGKGPFYVSRSDDNGVYFKLLTNREIFSKDEQIEIYIDTSLVERTKRDEYIYKISVLGEKIVEISDYGNNGYNRCNASIEIEGNTMNIFVPYEFLKIDKTMGLSFCYGIYSNVGLDWSPMMVYGVERSVEKPNEYIRVNY